MKRVRKFFVVLLSVLLLFVWSAPAALFPVRAEVTQLTVRHRFDVAAQAHELFWAAPEQPGRIVYNWHNPNGVQANPAPQSVPDALGTPNPIYRYVIENGRPTVVLRVPLLPDHVYNISIAVYSDAAGTALAAEGELHVLAGMTFEAESFDETANTLVERNPRLEDLAGNPVAPPLPLPNPVGKVISGIDPAIRLRWRIPTIFAEVGGAAGIYWLTEAAGGTDGWGSEIQRASGQPILDAGFYFEMNKGRNTFIPMEFKTYRHAGTGNLMLGGATIGSTPPEISGFLQPGDEGYRHGVPANPQGFVYTVLRKHNGIESGTEYQNLKMGLTLATTGGAPLLFGNTTLQVGRANAFPGRNTDAAFSDYGELSSVFTPIEYEMFKVDTDKVEVRFRRIQRGVYTKLFYEIQDLSGNDLNFPDSPDVRGNWITIPDSSLAPGTVFGSVILPFTVVDGRLPDRFIRVISSEQGALLPRNSSMANSLTLLGDQTGRPALPQNMTAEARYAGLNPVSSGGVTVEIPTSTVVFTFDKPGIWSAYTGSAWEAFSQSPAEDTDPVFHLLLSTLLPDVPDVQITDTTVSLSDAENTITVRNPARQKRTVTFGKAQLRESDGNPNRLEFEMDGTNLFMDFASEPDQSLTAENNEVGTRGPYPNFLIPNTTYYLQTFTSRYQDLAAINAMVWADRGAGVGGLPADGLPAELRGVISYTSPLQSFTTYPIREVPVPLPDFRLSVAPAMTSDPVTGKMQLDGIDVTYDHIMQTLDWRRYLSTEQWNLFETAALNAEGNRQVSVSVEYNFFIATRPSTAEADFFDAGSETVEYPLVGLIPPVRRIRSIPEGGAGRVLPNTSYFIKARPYLLVSEWPDGAAAPTNTRIGHTRDTAIRTITTPKLDLVSLENITRNPRAPTEFSIASDTEGSLLLTDASVVMQWMHRESDVGYEMMVTASVPDPNADPDEFANDPHMIDLLEEYRGRSPNLVPTGDNVLWLPLNDAAARAAMQAGLGLRKDAGTLAVAFPMDGFMEPNTQYYFSLRSVRSRGSLDLDGNQNPPPSRWITVPVTTPMVKAPQGFEIVRDLELGFSVVSSLPRGDPANFEIFMKRTMEPDSAYTKLSRGRYTLVRDGSTYFWRVGGLASDTWYDFRLRHVSQTPKWYNAATRSWQDSPGAPVTAKTRNALTEIEVRWIAEDAYDYFLEMRSEDEVNYVALQYSATGATDYGYETFAGGRTRYYRDRTAAQVAGGSHRFMLYARIGRRRVLAADGSLQSMPLRTNSLHHVRLWARNPAVAIVDAETLQKADSLRVGPISTRTDFSQTDYDLEKDKENILSLYETEAEQLTRKPYWLIDKGANRALRVLLKGDRIQAMLESEPEATQVIDLTLEHADPVAVEVLIPEQVLETLRRVNSRLSIRIPGAEYLISRSSFNLPLLRASVASSQVKETFLRLRITRSGAASPNAAASGGAGNTANSPGASRTSGSGAGSQGAAAISLPSLPAIPVLYTPVSTVFSFSAEAVGSRYTKGYLDTVIQKILEDPTAAGPFRYGLLDRERDALDRNAAAYTYRVHTDLADTVSALVDRVEGEMSRYLKDLIDGGSGLPSFSVQRAAVSSYPGSVLVSHAFTHAGGRILPLVLPMGTVTWREPSGMRAFTDSQVLFRIDGPSHTVVGSAGGALGLGVLRWPGLAAIAGRFDLTHAFGTRPLDPSRNVSGREAVLLFEVLTETTNEAQGLSMAQKLELLELGDIIQTRALQLPLDNQRALSWNVLLYARGTGRPVEELSPVATPVLANLSAVLPALRESVVLGLDLDLAELDTSRRFNATGVTNLGSMMEMAHRVLNLLGR